MYYIPQALIIGGTVCLALLVLVVGLRYGTAGHSTPSGHTSGRRDSPSHWG
jgi:hypothetical protein